MNNTQITNKLAILISWPREIDFFQKLIDEINSDYEFIIDDLVYIDRERKNNGNIIAKLFDNKKEDYKYISDVLNNERYKILISTGLSYIEKITIKSLAFFFYSRIIGSFFECSGLSNIFANIFKKRLSGGGKNRQIFEEIPIEKKISEICYHFPRGLDISMNAHPHPRWKNQYDYFLTHGNIDKKLIVNNFEGAKCIKIGYPKYDLNLSKTTTLNKICNELSIENIDKKLILWVPTFIKFENESLLNIDPWINIISELTNDYNVILRPHPKTFVTQKNYIEKIVKTFNIIVDVNPNRRMYELYNSSDLVLADYGGSVFSSIYLEKNILLLNLPSSSYYFKYISEQEKLELEVRNDLESLDDKTKDNAKNIIKSLLSKENDKQTSLLKKKYFGNSKENISLNKISNIISSQMEN